MVAEQEIKTLVYLVASPFSLPLHEFSSGLIVRLLIGMVLYSMAVQHTVYDISIAVRAG